VAYNKDQWTSSFEGQMNILRPHLTTRILATMSLAAWHRHGRNGEDPIEAAREWSKSLDKPAGGSNRKLTR
jgi:hypothetical protein